MNKYRDKHGHSSALAQREHFMDAPESYKYRDIIPIFTNKENKKYFFDLCGRKYNRNNNPNCHPKCLEKIHFIGINTTLSSGYPSIMVSWIFNIVLSSVIDRVAANL